MEGRIGLVSLVGFIRILIKNGEEKMRSIRIDRNYRWKLCYKTFLIKKRTLETISKQDITKLKPYFNSLQKVNFTNDFGK